MGLLDPYRAESQPNVQPAGDIVTLSERMRTTDWWFWAVSLALLALGLAGWSPGLLLFMAVSVIHAAVFTARDGIRSESTQVRVVYLAIAAVGLADPTRILLILLAIGTFMAVAFDRCFIAVVVHRLPWNRPVEPAT
ncbi:MAG: hypothetical protein HKN13_03805 [Rhodothermales bacterium]|nr:hypothetical protein [Rhodothermales bacterium]